METLPLDLVYIIARGEPALLFTCVEFLRLVDNHIKYDTMISRGYTINIGRNCIIWRKSGQTHRLDGPAFEKHNYAAWLRNGRLHREDGPAVVDDGDERYYVDNNYTSH